LVPVINETWYIKVSKSHCLTGVEASEKKVSEEAKKRGLVFSIVETPNEASVWERLVLRLL
jgi:hypothetical protein